jgi:hypothetical protein
MSNPDQREIQFLDPIQTIHSYATVHAAITALSVSVGRLDERLHAMHSALKSHTVNEHKSFDEALADVREVKSEVAALKLLVERGRGAGWVIAKIGAALIIGGSVVAWIVDHLPWAQKGG